MKLSVTCWSFPELTLKEVDGIAKTLGIEAIDVGLFYGSALDKSEVLGNSEVYGNKLQASLQSKIANYYHLFGDGLAHRNLALGRSDENEADLKAVLSFAKAADISTVFILPGVINPGQSRRTAFENSVAALKPLVDIAAETDIALTVEPHVHGLLESVEMVEELVDAVPGLKLTFDPAHFVSIGYRQDELSQLIPHIGHVHLRQAKQGFLQTKLEEGTINFPALFGDLRDAGYQNWLAIEYVHQAYMNTLFDDVLSETVKMRNCFNEWHAG
ncbi:sugar phosphate isomerase/epimerase family protein [Maritalea myrionectae]|uniref:sugar phosphate isomerase/epimerase family protein n=1 Tax=Maritalea myrionectae TaxID=454601 RepID=UPI0003F5CBFE|nr:sugar phosphate isomerase/epimerase [Maritalea myrionectae]